MTAYTTNATPRRRLFPTWLSVVASIFVSTLLLFPLSPLTAQSDEVARVIANMSSSASFRANFSISAGGATTRGTLSYQRGQFHLSLGDGRVISSSGREVIIYDPATGVAGRQAMAPGGGLGWLGSGYSVRSKSGNTAHLVAESANRPYAEVRLQWDESLFLRQLSLKRGAESDWVTITLSNLRRVDQFPAGLFSWRPPPGSRTVEQPLNQRY